MRGARSFAQPTSRTSPYSRFPIKLPSAIKTASFPYSCETFILTTSSGEITMQRLLRLCEDIGVRIMQSNLGFIIGPPQESQYAVEPVDVAIIIPSARYSFARTPLTSASTEIILYALSRIITSFSARLLFISVSFLNTRASSIIL